MILIDQLRAAIFPEQEASAKKVTNPVNTSTKSALSTGDGLQITARARQLVESGQGMVRKTLKTVTDPVADALHSAGNKATTVGKAADLLQPTGAANPRFQHLQEAGDHKFVRVKNEPEPWLGQRVLDRMWFGAKVEYIDPEEPPKKAKRVDGVVWNETLEDAKLVRGDLNPTYDDAKLGGKFESKLYEARFIEKYSPGAIAKTESVDDIAKELGLTRPKTLAERETYLAALQQGLQKRYPEGFILKGAFDANTGGNLPTNKSDFVALDRGYREQYLPFEKAKVKELEGDELINTLRGHEFKGGNVLDQIVKNPKRVIVQEKLKLARWTQEELPIDVQPFHEMRIHVLDGQVVPGASSHRWSVEKTIAQQQMIKRAEQYTQELFDKFPREVTSKLSFAPDIALLKDRSMKVIELNVGGYSGILYRNPLAARAVAEAVTGKELMANRVIRPIALMVSKSSKYAGQVLRRVSKSVRIE